MEKIVIEIDVAPPLVFFKVIFRGVSWTWDNKTKKPTRTLTAIIEDIFLLLCLRFCADGSVDTRRTTSLLNRTLNYYNGRRGLEHRRKRKTHFKVKR